MTATLYQYPPLSKQRGVGFLGFVILLVIVCMFAVVGIKVLPTFVEYRAIMGAVKKAQSSGSTIADIQRQFDRSATIDDITSIGAKDLEVTKDGDLVVVSFAYSKKIELYGPVSLVIDYKGSSKGL